MRLEKAKAAEKDGSDCGCVQDGRGARNQSEEGCRHGSQASHVTASEIDGEKEQEMWKRRVKRRRVMGAAE